MLEKISYPASFYLLLTSYSKRSIITRDRWPRNAGNFDYYSSTGVLWSNSILTTSWPQFSDCWQLNILKLMHTAKLIVFLTNWFSVPTNPRKTESPPECLVCSKLRYLSWQIFSLKWLTKSLMDIKIRIWETKIVKKKCTRWSRLWGSLWGAIKLKW